MADTKISNLPSKSTAVGTDVVPVVDILANPTQKINFKTIWEGGDNRYISPTFTYDGAGAILRIDYADTSYKVFSYTGDKLTQIDFQVVGSPTIIRKTLAYSGDTLLSITQTIV